MVEKQSKEVGEKFNPQLCEERHMNIDARLSKLENRFMALIILLLMNLGGIITLLIKS